MLWAGHCPPCLSPPSHQEFALPFSSDSHGAAEGPGPGKGEGGTGGLAGGSGSSTVTLLGTRWSTICLRGYQEGRQGRLLGGGGFRAQSGHQRWIVDPGQGQAGAGGQVMFSAHTPASWPPAPGLLISRSRSHVGQVGAVGKADMFISPLIS